MTVTKAQLDQLRQERQTPNHELVYTPQDTLETEPDGIPNKLNMPLSSTQFNVWYDLALAHYLKVKGPTTVLELITGLLP